MTSRFFPSFLFSPHLFALKRGEQLLEVRAEWEANSNHIPDSCHSANLKTQSSCYYQRDSGTNASPGAPRTSLSSPLADAAAWGGTETSCRMGAAKSQVPQTHNTNPAMLLLAATPTWGIFILQALGCASYSAASCFLLCLLHTDCLQGHTVSYIQNY